MEVAVFRRKLCMVSRAWYPTNVECCVSVSRVAQLRRSLLLLIDEMLHILRARQKKLVAVQQQAQLMWQERPAPETPMPEAPLIRVLETFDLSSTDVEHFLDSKADLEAFVPNSVAGTIEQHTRS